MAVSLLIAVGFCQIFGLFLEAEPSWPVGLVAGAVGFGLGLEILAARSPNTLEGQRLAPPAVVRRPMVTAIIILIPFVWITEARISTLGSKGATALATGPAAELIGLCAWS